MALPFRLYNTLSRRIEDFTPIEAGKIRLYVCGMTVYDHCHIGHARAMVVFDAFVRYLRHRQWDVTFVRNFTDVDDKIIDRSAETGEAPLALAQRYIDAFHEDVDNLGLIRPDQEPRVSTSIEPIQSLITTLVERGHAYVNEGTVWFRVESFEAYGKLSGQKVEALRSPDEVPGKRNPADFALWKTAKPGEPSWESPWGAGRPGWHIECSAMAGACLGETIDIHGGGLDLVFPHHENEIAQSECGHGVHFTRYWMHNGLLTMSSGEKMGKSLGNVINIREALAAFPSESLRLYYLQNLYRSPLLWNDSALLDALGMLARLYEARDVAEAMEGQEDPDVLAEQLGTNATRVLELSRSFKQRFYAALDEDFNTAQALGYAFELARAINRFDNQKKARQRGRPIAALALGALSHVTRALALLGMDTLTFQEEVKAKRLSAMGISREDVEAKVTQRMQARREKNWERADALRNELEALQILVMDTADGCEWRVRLI